MIERLLENWLDNASERSYQAVFSQLLVAQGYTVVHSTRHGPLEYGKDVLAIAPDGVGCAYQLKGNPAGRLTLDTFRREIQPQLVQLVAQPPMFPGFPAGPYRAYLVSNGTFDEEVQIAVAQMNTGPYLAHVHLISRGVLLEWARSLGSSLWPTELQQEALFLEIHVGDAADVLPADKLMGVLYPTLGIDEHPTASLTQREIERRASSAALLVGTLLGRYVERRNNYAVAVGWCCYCTALIAAVDSRRASWSRSLKETFRLAEQAFLDSLFELWLEVQSRKWLVEGDPMSDTEVYGWRCSVLLGALSCLALGMDKGALDSDGQLDSVRTWLSSGTAKPQLWGEGAVSALAVWLLARRKYEAGISVDQDIVALAGAVISGCLSSEGLPSPYFDIYDVLDAAIESRFMGLKLTPEFQRETRRGSSYTAQAVFNLAVRCGLKRPCKILWERYTQLTIRTFDWGEPWCFCLNRSRIGTELTIVPPLTGHWHELRRAAVSCDAERLPPFLVERPHILAFWMMIAPQRLTSASLGVLANEVLPGWGA